MLNEELKLSEAECAVTKAELVTGWLALSDTSYWTGSYEQYQREGSLTNLYAYNESPFEYFLNFKHSHKYDLVSYNYDLL